MITPDWPFHLAAILLGLLALFILYRSLLHNRSRGRRRCPKCWYDMSGADASREKGLVCPECGRDAKRERRLYKTRRRWGIAAIAGVIGLAAFITWKTPDVQRHGWIRAMPTLALLVAFPRVLDLDSEQIGSTSSQDSAITASKIATSIQEFGHQVRSETVRRYLADEMPRPAARWLACWAHRRESDAAAGSFDSHILRKIVGMGWVKGLVPLDEVEAKLRHIALRATRVREQWPAGVPIALELDIQELASYFSGGGAIVVRDSASRSLVRRQFGRLSPSGFVKHEFGWRPEPEGTIGSRSVGAQVMCTIEIWGATLPGRDFTEDTRWFAEEVALPVEIVPSLHDAAPAGDHPSVDDAIALLAPHLRADSMDPWPTVSWNAGALSDAIRLDNVTFAIDVEILKDGRVIFSQPLLVRAHAPHRDLPMAFGTERGEALGSVLPPDGWTLRLRSRPDLALLDLGSRTRWQGMVELPLKATSAR